MIVISTTNSSTTPLAAGGVFFGVGNNVSQFSSIRIAVRGSSVPGTIFVDFSPDGLIYQQVASYPVANPATFVPVVIKVTGTFYRLRYLNGATPQTTFRIQSSFTGDLLAGAGVVSGSATVNFVKQVFTLTPDQVAAKQVTIGSVPVNAAALSFDPYGGPRQRFGVDYTVNNTVVSWNGLGLDGFLDVNDVVEITYFT